MENHFETLLRQYSFFKEQYEKLSCLQSFRSTCIITIFPVKDDVKKSIPFPFGILEKNMIKGRLKLMNDALYKLSANERDFIMLRYFELQSRDFVMRYLRISSISTYKRWKRNILNKYAIALMSQGHFDTYFQDYISLKYNFLNNVSRQYH